MKQTRALAFISAVVLLAGSAAAPVAAADSVGSLKTVSTSDNLGGVAQVSPRINRWVTYKGYKYWFNSKGKMVKDAIIGINGKIYCFDARGRLMTSRFIRKGSIVYFADRRGQFLTGWQKINVYDDEDGKDDDYDYWFNFKSNGEKRKSKENWKNNGKYYSFNSNGVMIYQWAEIASSASTASVSNWRYFNSPEDGARATKGWFKVVAPGSDNDNTFKEDLSDTDTFAKKLADDEDDKWFYADSKGVLYEGEIKSIKGKYYGFRPDGDSKAGAMLTGLCILEMDPSDPGKIATVIDDDIDSDDLDDILDGKYTNDNSAYNQENWNSNVALYYFGNNEDTDGAMKTGNVTVNLDGSSYSFNFQKTGSAKSGRGKGVTGIDDKKYVYMYGCRVKADSDDKYQLVEVWNTNAGGSLSINTDGVMVKKLDPADFTDHYTNKDNETVNYAIPATTETNSELRLVNTAGNIQKNKTGVKDGNDCYYYLKDYKPMLYTDNKTLKSHKDDRTNYSDWKDIVGIK